jgi:hypothetical protein
MLEKFKAFPEPLQKQTALRVGYTAGFLLLSVLSVMTFRDWSMLAAGLIITAFCAIGCVKLIFIAEHGKYIIISGICEEVTLTPVRRRIKSILLRTIVEDAEIFIGVSVNNRLRKIQHGAALEIYVSDTSLMHEKDGVQQLHEYLIIDVKGRVKNETGK